MSPWALGSAKVEPLIASGSIQRLERADAGTQALIDRAHQLIRSAESLAADDPVTAYVVAYDGARHSGLDKQAHILASRIRFWCIGLQQLCFDET